jgi:hypothetical protein
LQQTANLVRVIALSSSMPAKHNRKAFEAFWSRSQAISELAMLVAEERVAVCNIFPDQAGLAGVFHDCGVPVLMQRFSTYCKDMCLDEPGRWTDLAEEDRRFNADHCVVGYLVAKHWNLPDFICDAIRYHHDVTQLGHHVARSMVAILQLAIQIYSEDRHLPNPEWESIRSEVLDELGLREDTLPELIDVVLEQYHGASHHHNDRRLRRPASGRSQGTAGSRCAPSPSQGRRCGAGGGGRRYGRTHGGRAGRAAGDPHGGNQPRAVFGAQRVAAGDCLKSSINEAHMLIKASRFINEKDPHSTAVMLLLQPGKVSWAHCGDSRLYRFRGDRLVFRTTDHSYVEATGGQGADHAEQALVHPNRNILLTSLGGNEPPRIDYGEADDLQAGDSFVLCSDGLWGYFSDAELGSLVASLFGARGSEQLITPSADAGRRARATTSRWSSSSWSKNRKNRRNGWLKAPRRRPGADRLRQGGDGACRIISFPGRPAARQPPGAACADVPDAPWPWPSRHRRGGDRVRRRRSRRAC